MHISYSTKLVPHTWQSSFILLASSTRLTAATPIIWCGWKSTCNRRGSLCKNGRPCQDLSGYRREGCGSILWGAVVSCCHLSMCSQSCTAIVISQPLRVFSLPIYNLNSNPVRGEAWNRLTHGWMPLGSLGSFEDPSQADDPGAQNTLFLKNGITKIPFSPPARWGSLDFSGLWDLNCKGRMLHRMSEDTSDRMPDRISEYVSDRMPE